MNLDSLLLEGDDRDEMKDVGSILAKVRIRVSIKHHSKAINVE